MSSNYAELFGGGGASADLWVSGATVNKNQYVISPLDSEIYRRTAASGAGATDPANDTTNYIAASYDRVSAIPIPTGVEHGNSNPVLWGNGVTKTTLNLTASTRTKVLGLTGRGSLTALAFLSGSGVLTAEVIIDGRTVTNGALPAYAACLVGSFSGGMYSGNFYPAYSLYPSGKVAFRRSLDVYVTATVTHSSSMLAHGFIPEA